MKMVKLKIDVFPRQRGRGVTAISTYSIPAHTPHLAHTPRLLGTSHAFNAGKVGGACGAILEHRAS